MRIKVVSLPEAVEARAFLKFSGFTKSENERVNGPGILIDSEDGNCELYVQDSMERLSGDS